MLFLRDYPGYNHTYVKKRVKEVVPMISSAIEFPDLEILQLQSENVTSSVCSMRERYSSLAMMLIHPFRSMNDLKDSHDNLFGLSL